MPRFALAALAALLVTAPAAPAAIVYDSGLAPGPFTSGVTADTANTSSIVSVDFTLPAPSVINEVKWAGKYYTNNVAPAVDSFTIRFYDLSGTTPTQPALFTYPVGNAVNRTPTAITSDFNGQSVYAYDALIPATTLPAGRYAFSVQDATTPANSGNVFFWTTAYFPGHQQFFDTFLLNDNFNSSFTLLGSVPEPSALLLSSLLPLSLRRRPPA